MNPQDIFGPNIDCPARGQTGKGNIGINSQEEQRFICVERQQTFTTTKGTIFYRLRTALVTDMLVITWLAYSCTIQTVVQVVIQHVDGHLNVPSYIVQGSHQVIRRDQHHFHRAPQQPCSKTRNLVREAETLEAGMYIVGCLYNFCDPHHSLLLELLVGSHGYRWVQRTPAMAASLTNHIWTSTELLNFKVPLPRWEPPKHRGRLSQQTLLLTEKWCS